LSAPEPAQLSREALLGLLPEEAPRSFGTGRSVMLTVPPDDTAGGGPLAAGRAAVPGGVVSPAEAASLPRGCNVRTNAMRLGEVPRLVKSAAGGLPPLMGVAGAGLGVTGGWIAGVWMAGFCMTGF